MTGVPLETRVALLRQHGSFSQAFSATVQPGLQHFGDARGFIAYRKILGTAMVLADPVAPRENYPELIARFLAAHPDTAFWQISRPTVELLVPLGFRINEMGPDNRIDLATYDFKGAKKESLRRATNRMISGGFVTRESSIAEVGLAEVLAVSQRWKGRRVVRRGEVMFINRPLPLTDEPDVRKLFTFDRQGKLVAFGFFDPVYENGEVVGYMSQHNRHLPEADAMVQFAIRREAIELFRKEGRRWLFLGLSPFAGIEDQDFRPHKDWLLRRGFRLAYTNGFFNRFIYPVQSLCEHKRRYHAITEQTYCAINRTPSLPRLLKLLRACNLV